MPHFPLSIHLHGSVDLRKPTSAELAQSHLEDEEDRAAFPAPPQASSIIVPRDFQLTLTHTHGAERVSMVASSPSSYGITELVCRRCNTRVEAEALVSLLISPPHIIREPIT